MRLQLKNKFLLICCFLFCLTGISQQNLLAFQPNTSFQNKSSMQSTSQLPLRFEHIGQKQGLEQKEIACIIQDRQGYLWLGTNDGLVRYDGYEFRTFKHQPGDTTSIPSGGIYDLFVDSRGWLWIGTTDGLILYDQNTDYFLQISRLSDSYKILKNSVYSISEDGSGSILMGTPYGLIKLIIPEKEALGNENIVSILLYKVTIKIISHVSIDANGQENYININSMALDSRGIIWMGTTYSGLQVILPTTNKSDSLEPDFRVINLQNFKKVSPSILSDRISQIIEDRNGAIWVATRNVLTKVDVFKNNSPDGISLEFKDYPIKDDPQIILDRDALYEFTENEKSIIWFGRSGCPFTAFDPLKETFISYDNNRENGSASHVPANVISIYRDRSGVYWFGTTRNGLYKYDPQKDRFLKYHPHLEKIPRMSQMNLRFVFEDSQGALWIAHEELFKCNRQTGEILYRFGEDLFDLHWAFLNDILEDRSGNIWIASEGRGLYRFDPRQNRFISISSLYDNEKSVHPLYTVTAITQDQHGHIWAATNNWNSPKDEGSKWLRYIFKFNTDGVRLQKFTVPLTNYYDEVDDCFIYDMVLDNSGFIWLGTNFGLARFDPLTNVVKQFQNAPRAPAYPENIGVKAVIFDPLKPGRFLWLGTNGSGLIRFNMETESFDFYTTNHGLSSNVIGSILSDNSGNLWVSTDQGISKVSLNEESREVIHCRNYDRKDGLKTVNYCFFYGQNAFKNGQGEMFFTGNDGFNIFDPIKLENPNPPPVVISNFQINFTSVSFRDADSPLDYPISKTRKIILPFEDNTFSFEITALDFHTPEKNMYAYKLTGFMDEWINLGSSRTAIFTQVPPGEYTFHAKACNSDGVWNKKGASLKIIILPPWWRTWWAYGIYVLLTLGIIFGLLRFEIRRREAKHKYELEHVEAQKLQELDQMKSRFFANISHEFRTPLTLILGPLEKLLGKTKDKKDKQDMTLAQRNAQRLLKLINELLDLSKLESGQMTLRASQLDIIQNLKKNLAFFESAANDRRISLKFQSEQDSLVGFFDADKLQKIFVNLISNAIKFTLEGGEVLVSVVKNIPPCPPSKGGVHLVPPFEGGLGGMLTILIKDTGIGIPRNDCPKFSTVSTR